MLKVNETGVNDTTFEEELIKMLAEGIIVGIRFTVSPVFVDYT